jgi:hypothetical protein
MTNILIALLSFFIGTTTILVALLPVIWKRAQLWVYDRDLDRRLRVRKAKRLAPKGSLPRAPNGRFVRRARG